MAFTVAFASGMMYALIPLAFALGLWYGAQLVADGEMDGGDVVSVFASVMVGKTAVSFIQPNLIVVGAGVSSAVSVFEACISSNCLLAYQNLAHGAQHHQPACMNKHCMVQQLGTGLQPTDVQELHSGGYMCPSVDLTCPHGGGLHFAVAMVTGMAIRYGCVRHLTFTPFAAVQVIDRIPAIDATSDSGRKLDYVKGAICLNDIVFSYPARPDERALNNVSVSFPAGKVTALVGSSGSGKSSIIGAWARGD